ncbi:MAG TPA: phosphopantetheine-binding protein [Actinocrinis sp.]|nr:phosphopantetheine-binding protein [Jatrophihabitans sp.]HEU5427012.1 phosphopantetheine-binding protein [Actinocrinis sp.]
MTVTDLHHDLADLIAQASDGQISAAQALAEPVPLGLLGLTSLGYVRLIQAVERRYDVTIEPDDDLAALDTVDALVEYLRERGIE